MEVSSRIERPAEKRVLTPYSMDENDYFHAKMAELEISNNMLQQRRLHTVPPPIIIANNVGVPPPPASSAIERTSGSPKPLLEASPSISDGESSIAQADSVSPAISPKGKGRPLPRPPRWRFRHPATLREGTDMTLGLTFQGAKDLFNSIMFGFYLSWWFLCSLQGVLPFLIVHTMVHATCRVPIAKAYLPYCPLPSVPDLLSQSSSFTLHLFEPIIIQFSSTVPEPSLDIIPLITIQHKVLGNVSTNAGELQVMATAQTDVEDFRFTVMESALIQRDAAYDYCTKYIDISRKAERSLRNFHNNCGFAAQQMIDVMKDHQFKIRKMRQEGAPLWDHFKRRIFRFFWTARKSPTNPYR